MMQFIAVYFTLLIVVIIHEFGHAYAGIKVGAELKEVTISLGKLYSFNWKWFVKKPFKVNIGIAPLVGMCNFKYKDITPKQKMLINVAGPLANIVTGLLFFLFYYIVIKHTVLSGIENSFRDLVYIFAGMLRDMVLYIVHLAYIFEPNHSDRLIMIPTDSMMNKFVFGLGVVSVATAALNMLPIFPFDGGHIVVNGYEHFRKDKKFPEAIKNIMLIGFIVYIAILPMIRAIVQIILSRL